MIKFSLYFLAYTFFLSLNLGYAWLGGFKVGNGNGIKNLSLVDRFHSLNSGILSRGEKRSDTDG